jgi:tricorn protease-like protein
VANVWLYNVRSGALRLVSADRRGQPSSAIGPVFRLDVSADGRFVTFGSLGHLVRSDTDNLSDVHLWEARTGDLRRLTGGQTSPFGTSLGSVAPAISDDGRHVAFDADTTELAPGGVPGQGEVYLWSAGPR